MSRDFRSADEAYAPIHVLSERLAAGETTASELLECYLQRIERYDATLHAFVEVYESEARAAARLADRALRSGKSASPLHGIPIAFKDLLHIAGKRTSGGSAFWRERISETTATVVQRLTDAGMITLGKTHMVEFAYGSWGTNTRLGTPRNPWDSRVHRVPGGSSSGSGVAVGGGLVPAAIGSDTGGSVRIPAALCGTVGLKTTVGRVSNHGVLMLSDTLDTLGPLTRDVEDAALLFDAMHGPDDKDLRTLAHARTRALADLKTGVKGLRLAVLPEAELGDVDPEVASAFSAALDVMRGLGASIKEIALPVRYKRLGDLTGKIIAAEAYDLHRNWIDRDDLPFDPDIRDRIRWGKTLSAGDRRQNLIDREHLKQQVEAVLDGFDALLTPATPIPAVPLADVDQGKSPMSLLTRPVNLLDLCALALPCGFSRDGLPISLQIIGRAFEEARILRIGWAFEHATDWHRRSPPEA